METTLILVRHGRTPENERGVMHSDTDPTPLSGEGQEQIQKLSLRLNKIGIDKLFSSSEVRARESAQIIADVCGVDHEVIDDLRERRWGVFTGKPWGEVEKVIGDMSIQERYTYIPEGGESWQQAERRLKGIIDELLDAFSGHTIVCVTHGGVIRTLMSYLLDKPLEETFKHLPGNASLTVFKHKDGKFEKVMVNNTDHLN